MAISNGRWQRTVKHEIRCTGIGLHSGKQVRMRLLPAPEDKGLFVTWSEGPLEGQELKIDWRHSVETPLCTTLVDGERRVATIEHLLSALSACGVDNLQIDLTAEELPAMDGSAAPFIYLLDCAGLREQSLPRKALRILKEVSLDDEDRRVSLTPAEGFSAFFEIDFESAAVGHQELDIQVTEKSYREEIGRARTFGLFEQVEYMRQNGFALGGSLDNAVVFKGEEVLNPDGLRYSDEPVRHKILDAIGDLYLAGAPIIGRYSGHRASHALNTRLLKTLFDQPDAWCWEEMSPAENWNRMGAGQLREAAVAAPA